MRISRRKPGMVSVLGIRSDVAIIVRELPWRLGPDQPDVVRRRLFPDPSDDPDVAAEWRRTQHPELFALLADSRRIVQHDLATLRFDGERGMKRLDLPVAHVSAWIAALNAARLTLGAIHDVTAADLDPSNPLAHDARGAAIARIDLYGWLQSLLIESVQPLT